MKKTLILGATTNPARIAYDAAFRLKNAGHEIIPVGIRKGEVAGEAIVNSREIQEDIDTLTLYIGPKNQPDWYEYILNTQPKRIIFNPGTENAELAKMAQDKGIEVDYACTLVLLGTGQY